MTAEHVISSKSCFGRLTAVLLVGAILSGCSQQGSGFAGLGDKETAGTAIGTVVGIGAGALLGGKSKALAMVLGGVLGAAAGNRIGAMLDDQDKRALAERSRLALLASADNSQMNWTSDHSGATATLVPTNTRVVSRTVKVVRDARVQPVAQLDPVGANYTVSNPASVHTRPGNDTEVISHLKSGDAVWAVSRVHDQPWYMVAQHGVTIGYVAASTIKPAPPKPKATTQTAKTFDLDAAPPVRSGADLDAIAANENNVKVETVVASVTCRDMNTTATLNGQSQSSTTTACRTPDGAWDIE